MSDFRFSSVWRRRHGQHFRLRLQRAHGGLVPGVVEAEAQPCPAVEQAEPEYIHVDEKRRGFGRDGGEDHVFQHAPDQWPGIGRSAGPDTAEPRQWRDRPSTALCLKLRIAHMLVQPGGQALAILVDDVVGSRRTGPSTRARSPTRLPSNFVYRRSTSRTIHDPPYQPQWRIQVPWNTSRKR